MQIRKYTLRFSSIFLFLFSCLLIFSFKLIFIQAFRSSYLSSLADKQHNHFIEIDPIRGAIYDRNLRPLAMNVSGYSLFADPKVMTQADKSEAISKLPRFLDVNSNFIEERLEKDKYFVWIKRKVSPQAVAQIKALKIKGIDFINESKRTYPNGKLAAHIIGFAGIDNEGLEGLELFHNNYLKGNSGWARILRDARQRGLMIENNFLPPKDGFHIVLTIDETIQYIAEHALDKAMEKNHAKAATIIVMDIKTGEILALANRPTYDLGDARTSDIENRTNRAISFVFEPGSVFKVVTAAAALEEKAFDEQDKIFCEHGAYKVANHILHDHTSHGILSFKEVFEQSSNIGVTKIAQKLGPQVIYKYADKFRFGKSTGIDLRGEVKGTLKPPSQWSKTSIGAIPIGQEVTVTPLQLICTLSAIANHGVYMKPFIVKYIADNQDQVIKSFEPQVVDQIISPETSKRLTEILVGVTEEGTAKLAQIKGMRVAGKTGTAQKVAGKAYSQDKFYATFMGYAPADNPRLAAIVVFDEPHPNHFGGTVCAPVFQEIVDNSLKYLENSESTATALNSARLF